MKYKISLPYVAGFLINVPSIFLIHSIEVGGVSLIYLVSFVVVVLSVYSNKVRFSASIFLLSFAFFAFYAAGGLGSEVYGFTLYKISFFILKCISLFYIGALISSSLDKSCENGFFRGYYLSLLLVFLLYVVHTFFYVLDGNVFSVNNRIEIGETNPIWVSRDTLELFIFTLVFFGSKHIFSIFTFIPTMGIVLLSGSKGPALSFLLSIFSYASLKTKITIMFVSIILLFILFSLLTSFVPPEFYDFLEQRFFKLVPDGASAHFVKESRDAIWLEVIERSSSDIYALLFGHGVGQSYQLLDIPPARYYPHNLLLELLYENGLIVTILFIFILIVAFNKRSPFCIFLLFHFSNSLFSGDILLNEKLFLFAGICLFYRPSVVLDNFSSNRSSV